MVIKDINSLLDHTKFNFDRLDYLQDTYLGLINIEQNKIIKTALFYLKQNNIESDFRFDVVSICGAEIEHIKNAFSPKTSKYYF